MCDEILKFSSQKMSCVDISLLVYFLLQSQFLSPKSKQADTTYGCSLHNDVLHCGPHPDAQRIFQGIFCAKWFLENRLPNKMNFAKILNTTNWISAGQIGFIWTLAWIDTFSLDILQNAHWRESHTMCSMLAHRLYAVNIFKTRLCQGCSPQPIPPNTGTVTSWLSPRHCCRKELWGRIIMELLQAVHFSSFSETQTSFIKLIAWWEATWCTKNMLWSL